MVEITEDRGWDDSKSWGTKAILEDIKREGGEAVIEFGNSKILARVSIFKGVWMRVNITETILRHAKEQDWRTEDYAELSAMLRYLADGVDEIVHGGT